MVERFKTIWFRAGLEKTKPSAPTGGGLVGKIARSVTETGQDPKSVSLDEFASQLASAYNKLDHDGYDVVNVVPVTVGENDLLTAGVAYSVTRGAVIVGKLRS